MTPRLAWSLLPLIRRRTQTTVRKPWRRPPRPAVRRLDKGNMSRILVVEDNDENRDALGRWLRRRGFDVLSAPDGRSGVEMARSESPDLILMDMDLPELNGWDATRQIRTGPTGAA